MLDKKTTERWFRDHYARMVHLARVMLGNDAEAEDLVQDVFVRLMEADIAPAEDKIEAYLMTTVRHRAINAVRHKTIWLRVKSLLPIDDAAMQPYEQVSERMAIVRESADGLDEPQRTIFRLRFGEDQTIADIARTMEMNANTCYKYLRQAIEHIRQTCKI